MAENENPVLKELESRLLETSDLVSSSASKIDTTIAEAIESTETSRKLSGKRIESEFGRELAFQAKEAGLSRTTQLESRRGFATQRVALDNLDERTEKSLRDLEQRKQELLLANDVAAAQQVSNLQLQALQFNQQAQQQVFSNLLALGNLGLQREQENRLARSQTFQEKQAIGNIALEFGLSVGENETLDSIVTRAAPLATEEQQLRLAKLQAETNRANAETKKALQGVEFDLDEPTAEVFASTLNSLATSGGDPTAIQSIEALLTSVQEQHGAEGLELVKRKQIGLRDIQFNEENLRISIQEDVDAGKSRGTILGAIEDNVLMSSEQKELARKIVDELKPSRPLIDLSKVGPVPATIDPQQPKFNFEEFFSGFDIPESDRPVRERVGR